MTNPLSELITKVLDETDLCGPEDVAREVFALIDNYEDATWIMLPGYVGDSLRRRRNAAPLGGVPRPPGYSAKQAGIRSAWSKRLRTQYEIEPGLWKFFGEMTADDLLYASEYRQKQAADLTSKSEYLLTVRRRLIEAGVDTVGELPEE